jgi:serine/threonine protein kinase
MDFGIAQIIDHQKLTMTGQLLGSPAYMAPELISGKPIDARTDLFAVGIMLYQLATGPCRSRAATRTRS